MAEIGQERTLSRTELQNEPCMSPRWALVVLLLPSLGSAGDICAHYQRKIEPDMQIQESDLTTDSARDAAAKLQQLLASHDHDQQDDFEVRNSLQILTGYTLRQKASEDAMQFGRASAQAKASEKAFCTWLTDRGFWYD